jgi:hypothetical protein
MEAVRKWVDALPQKKLTVDILSPGESEINPGP